MAFVFGKTSNERLNTCHQDLQKIARKVISISDVDFGIADGYRSPERQLQYFKEGKSKIDGVTKIGKHNYKPSLAVDIFAYYQNQAQWDEEHLSYLAGMFKAVSEMLFEQGEISHKIRWGGNWDMDGILLIDQSFDDRPHIELVKPIA